MSRFSLLTLGFALAFSTAATAQNYPTRPITWIVPFAAGGSTDLNARIIAKAMKDKLGQPVIIENKPGAGTIVGAEALINAKPDGYTFFYGSNTNLVNYEYLFKKRSFDPQKDLLPFHGLLTLPPTLVARGDAPYKTLTELVDYAKKNPGKINIASPGQNSAPHLVAELFMAEANIKMTHIPYKGAAPAMADLLAGVVDIIFDFPVGVQQYIDNGKLRLLAVPSQKRLPNIPNVPTFAEMGLPGVDFSTWAVMVLPVGTPPDVVDKLGDAFGKSLQDPEVKKYFDDQGANLIPITKSALTDFLATERVKMKRIVDRAGIQPE